MNKTAFLALASTSLALFVWSAALFAAWKLSDEEASFVQEKASTEQEAGRDATEVRLKALLDQTERERAALDEFIKVDILKAVDYIEETGRIAGVALKVGDATPLAKEGNQPPGSLNEVFLVVTADGSFAQLMHAEMLLESLLIPSIVEEVEWNKTGSGSGPGLWHFTARLRLLTASDIPS